ncbi:Glutamate--cysteine ligase [Neomoorella glycerini]|uniref:Glutamate--cysteine ligase n=1 Tax=Neomoorella glycerini TaxID=55779 RepID=A0A6I5ZRE7_9FIRM|nr:hypothetical protein [Moorella glycerini]QGP92318.1 Glutamate--cysteine ligase [Moorella glycerini]
MAPLLFGLEEEVFITEPGRPTLQSLYYLARLLWRDPADYYTHTACNFTRGKDLRFGLMSGIEISTGAFAEIPDLLADLERRRRELAAVCSGLIVPVGHLFDQEEPTNICGMHVHISGFPDRDRAYRNLVYFLPLLALLVINSPVAGNRCYGQSYRWAEAFAIGPLKEDRRYRFQDLIESKRLGTLEIRVFDPVWDLARIRILLECIQAILLADADYPGDIKVYNGLRLKVAREGYIEELRPVYRDLTRLLPLPEDLFRRTPADTVKEIWLREGTLATYAALDNAYRNGVLKPRPLPPAKVSWPLMLAGFCGYYLPRMPYNIKKVWSEW